MAKKVGLALGAGAARGLAHIGIIEILEENDIPIDYIAGTSMGAVISAYYALHKEVKGLREVLNKMNRKELWRLIDFCSPKYALIKGDRVHAFLDNLYGSKSFKDCKVPLRIVATDLAIGKQYVFKSGKLSDAVRASISIPGIFRPVEYNGKKLVDGGIVNSTPASVVRDMGAHSVIAVDLPVMKLKSDPNIFEIIVQSYEILREGTLARSNTIIITPDFSDRYAGHQFLNQQLIVEGRKSAEKQLKEIRKIL